MPSNQIENKPLSARIPADLSDWLDEEAETSRQSKTNVIVEALRDYREKMAALQRTEDKFASATREALAEADEPANLVDGEDVTRRLKDKVKALKSRKTS